MRISSQVAVGSPMLRLAALLAATATLVVVGGLAAGASLLPAPTVVLPRVQNGLIAYDDGGSHVWIVEPDGTGARRVTSGDTWEYAPSWSPDGRSLAYWSRDRSRGAEQYDLLVTPWEPTVSGEATSLATEYARDAATWSPDGRWLAYDPGSQFNNPDPRVTIVPATGGSSQELAFSGGPASWSPDAAEVAYYGRGGLVIEQREPDDANVLMRVPDAGERGGMAPAWSPSGDAIAFEDGRRIWLVDPDGTDRRDVTTDLGPEDDAMAPAWSPDGTRLAYVRCDGGTNGCAIVIADPDGGDPVGLSMPSAGTEGIAWSPDGTLVAAYARGSLVILDPAVPADPVRVQLEVPGRETGTWSRTGPSWQAVRSP